MSARLAGPILKDTVTDEWLPVTHGVAARGHVQHWELTSPVSIAKKKMSMSKVYTVGNTLGWASRMSTLKGHLCGAMAQHSTSITGQNINQMILVTRIVFILLVSFKIISTNGTMSTVQTVTGSPVRKVTSGSSSLRSS